MVMAMIHRWYVRCGSTVQVVEVEEDQNFEDAAVIAVGRALGAVDITALGRLTVGSRLGYDCLKDPDSLSIETPVLLERLRRLALANRAH